MKIAHVYARNLKIFSDALESTGCRINGSQNLTYLRKSLSNFNARDVMGLIVFRQHMTKRLLRLIKEFDELFVFNPLPIVVVCDDAEELVKERLLKVKNCPLFVVNSIGGTISDIDIRRIFTTLSVMSDTMYDLDVFEFNKRNTTVEGGVVKKEKGRLLADEVLEELAMLGGEVR